MNDQMTEELNRAVEQNLNPAGRGRLVGGDRNGAIAPRYAPDATQGDMLSAVAQHNEMLKSHLDTCIHALQELRAKL